MAEIRPGKEDKKKERRKKKKEKKKKTQGKNIMACPIS